MDAIFLAEGFVLDLVKPSLWRQVRDVVQEAVDQAILRVERERGFQFLEEKEGEFFDGK